MAVEFGTPDTWGMKVGQFLESKEYTLPQPKPQDVIEQRRKDSLREFLFNYPGAVQEETVDYIQRNELGQGGTSNILPLLNKEAQKDFGKNWPELDADARNKINSRVRARIYAEKNLKVDPAKNKNILRQKAAEKKLKDFAANFKKENGRVPMISEIKEGAGSGDREIKKYLKKSEYATPQQALKFKKPKEAKAIPDEMKDWFKKNYPGKDWAKDLNLSQRAGAKLKFENRNNPRVLARDEYKKLDNFLQKKKDSGKILFKGGLEDIAKEAKVNLKAFQVGDYINSKFPNEFVYRGTQISEVPKIRKRVAQLAKTLTDKQIYEKLVEEKLINPSGSKEKVGFKNVTKLMADLQEEGKIKNIIKNPLSQYTPQEEKFRDNLIKKFIDKNPDVDNANAIAKGINAVNPELRMSSNFVRGSVDRQNLGDFIQSRHKKIFSDVKALDKIIKATPELKTSDKISGVLKEDILAEYAAATGKNIAKAEGELVSRLRKLGHLYAGQEQRYEPELYSKIKPPKNYLDTKFQRNFINLTSQSGAISNISMAKLLGLPKADQNLIQGTASMMNAFDFNVAGDHTDIKAMMKDFPNYKKNFSRIEYVKDNLNEYKRTYDVQINNLRKKAELISGPAQADLLEKANKLQDEFNRKTGYRIGSFDINKGKVNINPETLRLPDLKNPYNKTLQQAMENFETTKNPKLGSIAATKSENFTGLDKRLMEATTSERVKIFKDVAGTPEARDSLYLKALQKIPKVGPLATKVMAGTAGAAAITTLAQADEPGVEDADSILPEVAVGSAAVAPLGTKKGRSVYGKAAKGLLKGLTTLGTPLGVLAGETFIPGGVRSQVQEEGVEETLRNPLSYAGLPLASLGAEAVKNPAIQRILNLGLPLKAIRAGTPVGLGLMGISALVDSALKFQEEFDALSPEEQKEYLKEQEEFGEDVQGAAEGGIIRLGLADGPKKKGLKNPGRRDFMKTSGKLAGILALIPYLGKFIAPAAKTPAVQEGFKLGVDKLMTLVDKIKLLGKKADKYSTKEREEITLYQGKDGASYELAEDLTTGDIRVTRDVEGSASYGDKSYDTIQDRSEFVIRKGETFVKDEGLETQKAIQSPDEYEEGKAVFDQDGTVADLDDVDDATIKAIEDEIN